MFKRLIYPLIFVLLAVLSAILTSDYAFPVIPGWHYSIGDHIFKAVFVLELLLVLTAAGYGLLAVKKRRINLILFLYQLLSTILVLILLRHPLWLWSPVYTTNNGEQASPAVYLVWSLFLSGQIWFYLYLLRAKQSAR